MSQRLASVDFLNSVSFVHHVNYLLLLQHSFGMSIFFLFFVCVRVRL